MDTGVGIVKAYLELCGYFVLAELPVRKQEGPAYRDVTDVDILAVRFPHPPATETELTTSSLHLLLGIDPRLQIFEQGVDVVIGEVKEGRAELNPALRRLETIAFALRRLGCCPPAEVSEQAANIARMGSQEMRMNGMRCRIRLILFAGQAFAQSSHPFTVPLGWCIEFIQDRMKAAPKAMAGTQWKDPTLGFFALLAKLSANGPADGEPGGTPETTNQAGSLPVMNKEKTR